MRNHNNGYQIIDYVRKQKEKLKPLVSNVIQSIDVSSWKQNKDKLQKNPNLTPQENQVVDLIQESIITVKQEKTEEKRLSDCRDVKC